jgi:hypothetical protein
VKSCQLVRKIFTRYTNETSQLSTPKIGMLTGEIPSRVLLLQEQSLLALELHPPTEFLEIVLIGDGLVKGVKACGIWHGERIRAYQSVH